VSVATIDARLMLLIIGMGIVTYLPRWFPLLFLSKRDLPVWLTEWLDFIPAAILSAILIPALLTDGSPKHLDLFRRESIVAIPTFLFALKTRSLGGSVLVGMTLYWLAEKLLR
jgi:branched-subunit amino acid transport protein